MFRKRVRFDGVSHSSELNQLSIPNNETIDRKRPHVLPYSKCMELGVFRHYSIVMPISPPKMLKDRIASNST